MSYIDPQKHVSYMNPQKDVSYINPHDISYINPNISIAIYWNVTVLTENHLNIHILKIHYEIPYKINEQFMHV